MLERTGFSQLKYVGHSQGTTQFFIANMLHDHEEFGSKIQKFVALSPPFFLGGLNSILMRAAINANADIFLYEHLPSILFLQPERHTLDWLVVNYAPTALTFIPRTTWTFVQGLTGMDAVSHLDLARMPMMARNDVGGTSTRNMAHWAQLVRTGVPETFSLNEEERVAYDQTKLMDSLKTTKMLLFRGTTDSCVVESDFAKLVPLLPQDQIEEVATIPDYDHLDYMWAKDNDSLVNEKLLAFIRDE